jgi:hypothetical protein
VKPQKFKIRLVVKREHSEPDCLEAELIVDGETLSAFDHGPLDLVEVERAATTTGVHFPWTCECGIPGCAGRFKGVAARCRNGHVSWKDKDLKQAYHFLSEEIEGALANVLAEGKRMLAK